MKPITQQKTTDILPSQANIDGYRHFVKVNGCLVSLEGGTAKRRSEIIPAILGGLLLAMVGYAVIVLFLII